MGRIRAQTARNRLQEVGVWHRYTFTGRILTLVLKMLGLLKQWRHVSF